jgi:hypothetical protein
MRQTQTLMTAIKKQQTSNANFRGYREISSTCQKLMDGTDLFLYMQVRALQSDRVSLSLIRSTQLA